ncbi:MAG: AMP-binding protein, partial [Myxococcales bacterium]|nr:AMP-binding protein [Myxococcales bacterium]
MARAILHADVVAERARLEPAREAILELSSGVRLSYGELDARADRLAAALSSSRGLGLAPGDRVAVLAGNQLRYVELFFAALRSGLVLVNLNTHLTAVELAGVIEDSGARALLYGAGLAERAGAIEAPSLERRVCLSDDAWLADSAHDPPPRALRDPEAACALIYTSGTTGKPKGVMLPSRMLGFNAVTTVIGWQLRDDDITAVFTPLYHAAGFGVFMLPLFCIGGRVVLHRGFDADEVLATVERERCTVVLGVPTIFERLAEHPRFASADLSSLRWVISGGAPLPRYLVDRYAERGVVLKQGFGMTEAGVNCFTMSCAEAHEKAGSIGRPLPFTEARVVDDAGAPLGPDEVGRLQLRGPHLFVGYFGDEQATAAAFDAEGWFDTGDLARTDTDGFFYIAGREKEMFISGGVNVYPAEVEAALLAHPAVRDAAVVAVPDARWGEAGIAAVVAAP